MYGYVRFEAGDEQSGRVKFAFITWIGPNVSPLKKAKVSTDEAFLEAIIKVTMIIQVTVITYEQNCTGNRDYK